MKVLLLVLAVVLALLALGLFATAAGADPGGPPAVYEPACQRAKQARFESLRGPATGPPIPDDRYEVLHYDVVIRVDFPTETIAGEVSVTGRSRVGSLSAVELDLHDNLAVSSVTRDGAPLAFSHASYRLAVTLDRTFSIGETFTIRVTYGGPPGQDGLLSFAFDAHDGAPIAATLSEPWFARDWWPCRETPAAKATVDVALTVPADMTAVSNGKLLDVSRDGAETTWRFHSDYPIATYLVSAAITNFATFSRTYALEDQRTMPVDLYAYPEDSVLAASAWDIVVPQMEYFRSLFGEYPFADEKYGMAEFPFIGGMEHQTITSLGSCCVTQETVIAHELAHQWWGDAVTCATWHDVWLNEGFATWCEALWYGHAHTHGGYREFMTALDPGSFPDAVYRYDLSTPWTIFTSVPYRKGAWVLHMLRGVLGDGPFFDALHAYRTAHAYGSATTEDFEAAVEASAGTELDWFFDEWIYGTGRPHYVYAWDAIGDAAVVTLRQAQREPPFVMPIEIDVVTTTGTERHRVWSSERHESYTFPVTSMVTDVRLDPDDWILDTQTLVALDVTSGWSTPAAARIDAVHPTPFSRSVRIDVSGCAGAAGSPVCARLEIFDVSGRRIATLLDATLDASPRTIVWDGSTAQGTEAPSGVYVLRLATPEGIDTRRLIRLR